MGNVYIGVLPEHLPATYSFPHIGDRRWAMLPWMERFEDSAPLRSMAHMAMHVHQSVIFGQPEGWNNSHMENRSARVLIQLEINALLHALENPGEREQVILDALSIRAERRRLFPGGIRSENVFEVHEGLADYTDIRLTNLGFEETINDRERTAASMRHAPSLSNVFGYISGSLYGLLLDETGVSWRGYVSYGVDLGRMLQDALEITQIPLFAEIDLTPYGYDDIIAFETEREANHNQMLADIREQFITLSTLQIPGYLKGGSMQIMPARVFPIAGLGTAFGGPTVIVSGIFGQLIVYDGFFIRQEIYPVGGMVIAAGKVREDNRYTAPGWVLELNEGFRLRSYDNLYIVGR